jgi:hypothetical protein
MRAIGVKRILELLMFVNCLVNLEGKTEHLTNYIGHSEDVKDLHGSTVPCPLKL